MFWKKKQSTVTKEEEPSQPKGEKLPGPRDIPPPLGSYMVVSMNVDPDIVWNLKAVMRQREESADAVDVRLFSRAKADAKNVSVKNYLSLDAYPDLILYEGWWNKKTKVIQLQDKKKAS